MGFAMKLRAATRGDAPNKQGSSEVITAKTTLFVALLVLVALAAPPANAQTSYIGVFFDCALWDPAPTGPPDIGDGTTETAIPPAVFGTLDTLCVVAYNTCLVLGFEFKVDLGPCLAFIADFDKPGSPGGKPGVTLGNSNTGVSMAFGTPQLGTAFPVNLLRILVQWQCTDCAVGNVPVKVVGHPLFNPGLDPQYTCLFQIPLFQAKGLTALICPTVPVEETTWGRVKSLYVD